ncbi:MAG: plasmid replication protein RepC [Opitutaceae bacterium]|nr:plasmid replication protein RepC [Opitutaceae bacterium]
MRLNDQAERGRVPPPLPSRSTGLRRLTPPMLPTARLADGFAGGDITPGQALAAFKAAAPYLGIGPRVAQAVDWLFRFTQPQDWQPGARPMVWPSAAMQTAELGITETQAKRLNRHLAELGLIVMRDSPNGKRYGRRDKTGHIIEAYGFDLSPIALRIEEFRAIAEAGREERAAVAGLRRRASIARASLRQTWETYREQQIEAPADLRSAGQAASRGLKGLDASRRLRPAVEALEDAAANARRSLETALAVASQASQTAADPVNMCPRGHADVPHITATNHLLNPKKDTVIAQRECSRGGQPGRTAPAEAVTRPERRDRGTVMKLSTDELVRLAPRLRPYLGGPSPTWPEVVDAADWLRHDLGVSKPLWGEACMTMGREQAAIALALVSAKPAEHFRSSPGGYFHAMVERARTGALHLERTIWGMRGAKTAKN